MNRWVGLGWLALPLLGGCGSGDGGSGSGDAVPVVTAMSASSATAPTAAPAATPTPAPTATPTPTATVAASAAPAGFAGQAAALYDVVPDPATCSPGTLKASVKADLLAHLNAIRALHNLPAVTYSTSEDGDEQQSSLMMAVNRQLSHTPPTGWTCYTSGGAAGAGASNLIGGWGSGLSFGSEDDNLAGWLNEGGSNAIGHRRWILDPFLGQASYGRVAYASANGDHVSTASLRVFSFASGAAVSSSLPAFVAYPFNDYPVRYFRATDYLSFTVVANAASSFGSNASVGFAGATITVTGPSGLLAVSDVASDNEGYGIPNSVEWRVAGLQAGVTYTVRIAGITGAPQSSYTYSFRIVN
jgi:uncharacterized protein YkwD